MTVLILHLLTHWNRGILCHECKQSLNRDAQIQKERANIASVKSLVKHLIRLVKHKHNQDKINNLLVITVINISFHAAV